MLPDVISHPVADFRGGIGLSAVRKILGDNAGIDGSLHRLPDHAALLLHLEGIFEHHRGREDGGERICYVLACGLRIGAVNRLEHTGMLADGGRCKQAHRAGNAACLVCENVAEGILSN